jgi:hypothetical protein
MKFKKLSSILIIVSMIVVIGGCGQQVAKKRTPPIAGTPENATQYGKNIPILKPNISNIYKVAALLPNKINYIWKYEGFAEYGHRMRLNKIEKTSDKIRYLIDGTVDDMSGGASKRNFKIKLNYVISNGTLTQNKTEEVMMDSIFNSFDLVRLPLKKGSKWTQAAVDKTGKTHIMESTITTINKEKGKNVYTIFYKDRNSNYYEKRKIKDGAGVIYFEKLYVNGKEAFPVSYSINTSATGYNK